MVRKTTPRPSPKRPPAAKRSPGKKPPAASRAPARKKPRAKARPSRRGRRLAAWALGLCLLAAAGLVVYGGLASVQMRSRFGGQVWSLPSRVYSDAPLYYPGMALSQAAFTDALETRGYQAVKGEPRAKGQFASRPGRVSVYLRDLALPDQQRAGFPATLSFSAQGLEQITRQDGGPEPDLLTLEPVELGSFFGPERESRELVSLANLPPHLVHAVLAAEDADFYSHHGLDYLGILRAMWVNLRQGAIRQGGSTISQQLVKNYFLAPERTLTRKIKEAFLALVLEATFPKDQILEIYLNEIYLGQSGSVAIAGVGEAALFYFGRPARELKVPQAALLAGLISAPNALEPRRHPRAAQERRNQVLRAMAQKGWLPAAELPARLQAPLEVTPYRAYARRAPYFMQFVSRQLGELYTPEQLTTLGLAIHTTLDWQVQEAAEKALAQGLARLEKESPRLVAKGQPRLQGAVLVMEPQTGHILALVGGRDFGASQFDRVSQARRQPGSTFKPFVYLAALDQFSPLSLLSNEPHAYPVEGNKTWTPDNYSPYPAAQVTLADALAHSLNRPTVDLAVREGLSQVVATAGRFGFAGPLPAYPSLALGAAEVTPLELARAYAALAAGGVLPLPLAVRQVGSPAGQELLRRPVRKEQVASPAQTYVLSALLRGVVERGTAQGLRRLGITAPVAGKTGTTSDYRDAWFVGYTPDLLALVWVGFDDGRPLGRTGGQAALPIWASLVRQVPWRLSGEWPAPPPGVRALSVCTQSNLLAGPNCPTTRTVYFLDTVVPDRHCNLHGNPVGTFIKGIGDALQRLVH
ncbi:MAG: PBP1A family penicillin-binding protein [Deltaproteobacteria bacterium]|nr:PBP1A family penicillin-binding protein [Deltaproteobacteria bacterium]